MSPFDHRIAARMEGIAPSHIMAILARAQALKAAGHDIIHLEISEPDLATPEPIIEAGITALRAGHPHYTSALGLPNLREAIAGFYTTRWQRNGRPSTNRGDPRRVRCDFLLPALRNLGFHIPIAPQGAFYLYADCSRFTPDSNAFANQ